MSFTTLRYAVDGRIARITLDRPDRLNAISRAMPEELAAAVARADDDDRVHAIALSGAGRAFCAGYDLKEFAEDPENPFTQDMPWDPTRDYRFMRRCTDAFMSLWRSPADDREGPRLRGRRGSDIALCCDLVVMAEDARIGYPPARVWGCPTTAMWVYRIGPERAKRMLFTGDLIDGREAAAMGLVLEATPAEALDDRVEALLARVAGVPKNQLMMHKMVINQAVEAMGLGRTQTLATFFDGVTRHSPEGPGFKRYAEDHGFHAAVAWRDSGRPIPEGGEE